MPIQDLARSDVVTIGPEASVMTVAAAMDEEGVGSIVVTEDGDPIGIVTDRDLAVRVLAEGQEPSELSVADVMTSDLQTVDVDTGFYQVADLMSDHGVRRLPVCEADGTLAGIITADDLTELLADEQSHLADVIRAQRPEY